ncbi:hypothetical protein BDA96_02G099300 [Sorghum bicolor]|uniref:Thioesterase domain-containing protein n=2 Tax=Sorghum bicolor TaxID=4558 RepID=A0A921RLI6_SORBI|nr:hypothetical protein SORBI_3002G096300 [Sorghum bicolor]KAG0542387.1 hypothetical protein BDA96_02G099300 [Sorghum bicolor]
MAMPEGSTGVACNEDARGGQRPHGGGAQDSGAAAAPRGKLRKNPGVLRPRNGRARGLRRCGFASRLVQPGPGALFASQTLKFAAPVCVGDEVVARVQALHIIRTTGATKCSTTSG